MNSDKKTLMMLTSECEEGFERVIRGFKSRCPVVDLSSMQPVLPSECPSEDEPMVKWLPPFVTMVNGVIVEEGEGCPFATTQITALEQFSEGFFNYRKFHTGNTLFWRVYPTLRDFFTPVLEGKGEHRMVVNSNHAHCFACGASEEMIHDSIAFHEKCLEKDKPVSQVRIYQVRARFLIGDLP